MRIARNFSVYHCALSIAIIILMSMMQILSLTIPRLFTTHIKKAQKLIGQTSKLRKVSFVTTAGLLNTSENVSPLQLNNQQLPKYPDNEDDYIIDDYDKEQVKSINAAVREGSLKVKVRQHVNPLASKYQIPLTLEPDWLSHSFENISNPIHIDVGCAKGSWVLKYGMERPSVNILGLEIRRPVVELCLHRKKIWNLKNVNFLSSNANVDLKTVLESLRQKNAVIKCISVQFPDPHFKKRHHKRRVLNTDLVFTLAQYLHPGAQVFVQSDILDVMQDMVFHLQSSKYFRVSDTHDPSMLDKNQSPFPVQTEREIATLAKNLPVYRLLFIRNEEKIM